MSTKRDAPSSYFKPNRYFLELIVGAGFSRSKSRLIYDALFAQITEALLAEEFTDEEIGMIMGRNVLGLLVLNLP